MPVRRARDGGRSPERRVVAVAGCIGPSALAPTPYSNVGLGVALYSAQENTQRDKSNESDAGGSQQQRWSSGYIAFPRHPEDAPICLLSFFHEGPRVVSSSVNRKYGPST